MQELEEILEEMREASVFAKNYDGSVAECVTIGAAERILRKHTKNDGWIPVDEPPKKDYITVFAVDKHDYYFVAVYDKEHGYRTNDVGADVDNIVAYRLFNQYRPERSDNHDGE